MVALASRSRSARPRSEHDSFLCGATTPAAAGDGGDSTSSTTRAQNAIARRAAPGAQAEPAPGDRKPAPQSRRRGSGDDPIGTGPAWPSVTATTETSPLSLTTLFRPRAPAP